MKYRMIISEVMLHLGLLRREGAQTKLELDLKYLSNVGAELLVSFLLLMQHSGGD